MHKDIYYESIATVQGPRNNRIFIYDGTSEGAISEIKTKLPEGQKLDLFVAEFHKNIAGRSGQRYQQEDLKTLVNGLFERDLASDRFTVALDHTIGTTDAEEVRDFFKDNEARIASGV